MRDTYGPAMVFLHTAVPPGSGLGEGCKGPRQVSTQDRSASGLSYVYFKDQPDEEAPVMVS